MMGMKKWNKQMKESKMSKTEVATQENKELAAHQQGNWGAGKDVDANDILIPKILCAQAIS